MKSSNPFSMRLRGARALIPVAVLAVLFSGCSKEDQKPPPPPPVEIKAVAAQAKDAPLYVTGIGHVVSMRTVSVRAQITGYLKSIHFAEGALVKEGDRLFTIDPAPFESRVKSADATLKKDRATAEQAGRDFKRYDELLSRKAVSVDDMEQRRTAFEQASQQVAADEASLRDAKINLSYCFIDSPVTGATGYQNVKAGNLVAANQDVLTTINQVQPILVQFAIPEKDLPQVRRYFGKGLSLPVTVKPSSSSKTAGEKFAETGALTVVNNTVDTKTGMILLQAEFANDDLMLWPGQFVDARVTLTAEPDTVMVPSQAIASRQEGQLAFVIKPDNTVELRPVQIGREIGDEVTIASGLKAGEMVAVTGQLKLLPGATVKIVDK
ncbi:MAG: efflux RND transporter periplasmic adaptor subunit [Desulfovibrionaceae bacterium]|nr:efflux RND transporter periplasmic adaptor subunit [Desulfovibrionaceae bacterium]MBF0512736.1 efflux RND transporter periplasmic adaptor subunit [Desulfovibrionaceae bacterium]